ncbi:MAG: cytochrome c [Planctomycetes bacterium]|nr:cytochrome c [Planctomycetota bacterium]
MFFAAWPLGCGGSGGGAQEKAPLPGRAEEGKVIFMRRCSLCHGEDGKAETPSGRNLAVQDLTETNWQKATPDEEIAQVVRHGKDKMPAFGRHLSAQDLADLIAFVRTLNAL